MAGPQYPEPVAREAGFQEDEDDSPMTLQDDESAAMSLLRYTEDQFDCVEDPLEEDLETDKDSQREKWNSPRINAYRYCGVNLSFFIMGMHDGCIGVRIDAGHLSFVRPFEPTLHTDKT